MKSRRRMEKEAKFAFEKTGASTSSVNQTFVTREITDVFKVIGVFKDLDFGVGIN
jgi:hypothetical protein